MIVSVLPASIPDPFHGFQFGFGRMTRIQPGPDPDPQHWFKPSAKIIRPVILVKWRGTNVADSDAHKYKCVQLLKNT